MPFESAARPFRRVETRRHWRDTSTRLCQRVRGVPGLAVPLDQARALQDLEMVIDNRLSRRIQVSSDPNHVSRVPGKNENDSETSHVGSNSEFARHFSLRAVVVNFWLGVE